MKFHLTHVLTACLFLTSLSLFALEEWVQHKTADGLHPSGEEQQMVWLMNRARAFPAREGQWLADGAGDSARSELAFFKVNTALLKSEFAALTPQQPAAFDRRIYEAAKLHSQYLIANDRQDHTGQNERMQASGFTHAGASYSVFSYAESALNAHAAFNIDWGNEADGMQFGRGHRAGLMASGKIDSTNLGVAILPENNSSTDVGPLVCSINYAIAAFWIQDGTHHNRFLVGTVWTDDNSNSLYDSGEGLAGVEVRLSSGEFFAVTGEAGGYAIPVQQPGRYEVSFSQGELPQPRTTVAVVGENSVLLDLAYVDSTVQQALGASTRSYDGYQLSTWLGEYADFAPTLYSPQLGWLYVVGDGKTVFFYDFSMHGGTWLYSGPDVFPFFYDFHRNEWLWFYTKSGDTRFFVRFTGGGTVVEGYP